MSKLVPMAKDGEMLSVHPSTVDEHQRLGWSVSQKQAAPAEAPELPKENDDGAPVVEIPADWRDLKWFSMKALAANFTDQPIENKPEAEKIIEAELERRGKA
ncbi:conserved hypothetical protein [Hyphomicrobiales bacterium]|nr:conserved hypothetical protein [Hyphomicrobiales bacterium]CAH1664122.1 conserved hypothetical protein [Hyphomicrobiales bacterium]